MNDILITLSNRIELQVSGLPDKVADQIRAFLTLPNPKYEEAKKRGYSLYGIPKLLLFYREIEDNRIICLRGFMGNLLSILRENGLSYHLVDLRRILPELNLEFSGNLRAYQKKAVTETLKKDFGVIVAPCGSGKTVIACAIMATRKQPTLIICHTRELLNQWRDRIEQYLQIPRSEIGIIGTGKEIIKPITVGMVQTLCKRDLVEIRQHFGQIVVDECHHCPASSFIKVVASFDCKYMLGLSATPYRRDGLNKLIYAILGNVSVEISDSELQDSGCRIKPEIIVRETDFDFDYQEDSDYQPMISELAEDHDRNELIVSDVIRESQENGNLSLILSDRKSHCEALAGLLRDQGIKCAVLTSDRSKKDRGAIIRDIESGALKVVCATGQLAGEGLDIPRLNRLFVITPIRFKGRITQYVGRALRVDREKIDSKIYDYHDSKIGVRCRVYNSLN